VCSLGRAVISGDNKADSSTQVPIDKSAWVPVALSYHARHLLPLPFMELAPIAYPGAEKLSGVAVRGSGMLQARL
jgi:hypothetical protein